MFYGLTLYLQRMRMVIYAVIVVVFGVLSTLPVTLLWSNNAWHFVRATDPRAIDLFWAQGAANVIATLTIVLAFCAADLGVTAVVDDSTQKSLEWIVSRPCSRQKIAWSGWAGGLSNVILLIGVGMLTLFAVLFASTHTVDVPRMAEAGGSLLATSFAIFSLAFALSTGTGSVRNGFLFALFGLVFFGVGRFAYFNIVLHRYVPLWLMSMNNLYQPRMNAITAISMFVVAMLFSLGGAMAFGRRDI